MPLTGFEPVRFLHRGILSPLHGKNAIFQASKKPIKMSSFKPKRLKTARNCTFLVCVKNSQNQPTSPFFPKLFTKKSDTTHNMKHPMFYLFIILCKYYKAKMPKKFTMPVIIPLSATEEPVTTPSNLSCGTGP